MMTVNEVSRLTGVASVLCSIMINGAVKAHRTQYGRI